MAAPTLAASLSALAGRRWVSSPQSGRPWVSRLLAVLLGVLVVLSLPWLRPYVSTGRISPSLMAPGTPVQAVATLCQLAEARRVFNEQSYGVYMIWACPQKPVFIDTRLELYPIEQWFDYQAIVDARYDWQQLLDDYQIDTLLLDRQEQEQLVKAALSSGVWHSIYQDEQATILAKTQP